MNAKWKALVTVRDIKPPCDVTFYSDKEIRSDATNDVYWQAKKEGFRNYSVKNVVRHDNSAAVVVTMLKEHFG